MEKKSLPLILLILILTCSLGCLPIIFGLPEEAENIYIRADGSVDPDTAPLMRVANVYTLTADMNNKSIVVERNNIMINGNGYTLQGPGTGNGIGFNLTEVENVEIANTNIMGFQYGVYLSRDINASIINNNITDNFLGIKLYNSDDCKISGNNVKDSTDRGIHVTYSRNSVIEGNNASGNGREGIAVEYSTNNKVLDTEAIKNIYGINVENSLQCQVSGNHVVSNKWGIKLYISSSCLLSNNSAAENEYNIMIDSSSESTLRNNTMTGYNYNFGVQGVDLGHYIQDIDTSNTVNGKPVYYLINQHNLTVDSSTHPSIGYLAFINSTNITAKDLQGAKTFQGVFFAYTSNSRITNVTASGNKYGISLYRCSNSVVSNSKITFAAYSGIIFKNSSNCHVVNSELTGNIDGIYLIYSTECTVNGNKIIDNDDNGIRLAHTSSNNIFSNYIAENSENGVILDSAEGNLFSNNYFLNNGNQVYDVSRDHPETSDVSINSWDDGEKGNYWSDYNGVDENGDYIGDTPYVIDSDNLDYFPLMRAQINIQSPENKLYAVKDVPLTFTTSESPDWIGYVLDGQENVTINGNATLLGLSDGEHSIIVYMNNSAGYAVNSIVASFSVDTVSPTIEIVSPIGNNIYEANSVPLSFTASESTTWVGYSLNGQETVTINGNTTISKLADGVYRLTVYAQDVAGNVGSSESIVFTVRLEQISRFSDEILAGVIAIAVVGVALIWRRTFLLKHVGFLNLVALFLIAFGAYFLAWVSWLTYYDVTVWSKDLGLIFFGSRAGEAISLGIGMKLIYYFLIGLAFLLSGLVVFLRRQVNSFVTQLIEVVRTRLM